ncbi:MAG: M23 family metallopeptidase [Gemmatimonadota bacterium]
MKRRLGGLTIVLVPEESGETRTFRLSPRRVRVAIMAGILILLLGGAMATSWWYLALNTARSWQLQAVVDSLEGERLQVLSLAEDLTRVEEEYERLRSLFGSTESPIAPDLWLPPSALPGSRAVSQGVGSDDHLPTSWPLTEAGYITQSMVTGGAGEHPGLDIAIPTDSYVRAAGSGRVLRVGEDPLYGFFVVLEHGDGYQTVYAHASAILVERGQTVRRNEVVALSGSTGRSTAPHLHFEILLDGLPVDPLFMVEQPN